MLDVEKVTAASTKVALFATTPDAVPALRGVLQRMSATDARMAALIRVLPAQDEVRQAAGQAGVQPASSI